MEKNGTPESESSNFECYQNYTAPEVFVQHIAGIVNQGDVEIIVRAQKQMLQRFEKTNEMLINCNALSNGRLKAANDDFKKHIKLINEMKKDLDYIFKKIRSIKSRIDMQYPDARTEQKLKNLSLSEESREDDISPNTSEPHNIKGCISGNKRKKNTSKGLKSTDRKLSKDCVTVNYVQMEASTENGICILGNEGKIDNDSTDSSSSDT